MAPNSSNPELQSTSTGLDVPAYDDIRASLKRFQHFAESLIKATTSTLAFGSQGRLPDK